MSSLPDRFQHYAWTAALLAHSHFIWSRVYASLSETCYLHFGQNDGSFTCQCDNTGVGWTPNKSQHTKLTLKKKIPPPLLRDSNPKPFDHELGALSTSCPGTGTNLMQKTDRKKRKKKRERETERRSDTFVDAIVGYVLFRMLSPIYGNTLSWFFSTKKKCLG